MQRLCLKYSDNSLAEQADSRGQSMYATSEAGSLGAETSLPESSASVPSSASATASDTITSSQAAEPTVDQSFQAAEAAEPVKSTTELASESDAALGSKQGPSHSAHEVLRSHSESGDFHDTGQLSSHLRTLSLMSFQ